jgi:hypothetical protein
MSELDLLENLAELSILYNLNKHYKLEIMDFCNFGDIVALAGEEGLKVTGNIHGGSINKHYFGLGAVSVLVVSDVLKAKLDKPGATNAPVGFDNLKAPKCKGAIAKQFSFAKIEGKTDDQSDGDVVKAYYDQATETLEYCCEFPQWLVPEVKATDILKRQKSRFIINWPLLPKKFYIRVLGSEDDYECIIDICESERVPCMKTEQGIYISNITRDRFPPLAEHLFGYDFGISTGEVERPQPPQGAVPPQGAPAGARAHNAGNNSGLSAELPECWSVMCAHPSRCTYEKVSTSQAFKEAVRANSRKCGSNKHKTTSSLLGRWPYGERKSVGEFIQLCAFFYKDDEQMQAKLFFSIQSHLRLDGEDLIREDI